MYKSLGGIFCTDHVTLHAVPPVARRNGDGSAVLFSDAEGVTETAGNSWK